MNRLYKKARLESGLDSCLPDYAWSIFRVTAFAGSIFCIPDFTGMAKKSAFLAVFAKKDRIIMVLIR